MSGIGKKKSVIEIDYNEVDRLAQETYGHNPEIVASEEWNNDEEHSIEVDGELDKWDLEALTKFIKTGHASFGIARILLNDLARQNLIEKGEYLVTVSW